MIRFTPLAAVQRRTLRRFFNATSSGARSVWQAWRLMLKGRRDAAIERKALAELHAKDDRELADIGLSRSDLYGSLVASRQPCPADNARRPAPPARQRAANAAAPEARSHSHPCHLLLIPGSGDRRGVPGDQR